MWQAVLFASVFVMAVLYGIGIIATNTPFSVGFEKSFYWVAIAWSLGTSALFAWIAHAFGGSRRDMCAAFLSAIAIWVVIIQVSTYPWPWLFLWRKPSLWLGDNTNKYLQIGQTHLGTEAQKASNNMNSTQRG